MMRAAVLGLVIGALLHASAFAAPATLPDIEDEVMCPVCGTTLELANGEQADRERALIRRLIEQGRDKQQVEDALVAEYGPTVLATPSGHGFDLAAWLVPGAVILLVAAALPFFLRRRRREPQAAAARADIPTPSVDDLARLDRDLSSHDL
jgi:cytochrome c-type biogenesis protein CcmH